MKPRSTPENAVTDTDRCPSRQRRILLLSSLKSIALLTAGAAFANRGVAADKAQPPAPHVTLDDPQAKALQYVNDATKATRPDKGGTKGADQFCHNCQFLQGDSGEWRPCQIFAGKEVNENGWCITWTPKTT